MSNLNDEIKATEAKLEELKAQKARETETHGFNFRDIAELFGSEKTPETKDEKSLDADLETFLGIDKDKNAFHNQAQVKDIEARIAEINKTLAEIFDVKEEPEAEEAIDLGKVFNDTVAQVKTKGEELFTKVKGPEAVAKVKENELFNKAQAKATDLFTKVKTKATDAVTAGKNKFDEICDDYNYFKELKADYPDVELVKVGEDTFSVHLPQFGNNFVFTFVDKHNLVAIDYIANEVQEPAPVKEDGEMVSVVSGHAHVHHTIEFVEPIEVEGLDDVDTLNEVLTDYFEL